MTDIEFVIRTVGERTEDVCIELVNRQKKEYEILHVLRENTHLKAVESTIRIGINSNAKWLIAIDADMLLTPESLQSIRKEISISSSDTAIIHPAVVDKMYRMRRWGLTVYRRSILNELDDKFQEIREKQHLKIEGAAIKALSEKKNRQVVFSRNVAAIHDFYQFYRDLYRKAYLNTLRNPGYNKQAAKHWKRLAGADSDYLIMLKAMNDALKEKKSLTNSVSDFDSAKLEEIVVNQGLTEKSNFSWDEYVDECYANYMNTEIGKIDHDRMFSDYFETPKKYIRFRSFSSRIKNSLRMN